MSKAPCLKFTIFLSLLSHTVLSTLLILTVCRTRVTTNSVNMTSLATSLPWPVAQWLERPTGVREDSDFFYLSHARDKLNLPSFSFLSELKIYHLSYVYSEIEIEWNAFKETAS